MIKFVFFRNLVLNKSFDVIPQIKDNENGFDDHVNKNKKIKLFDQNDIFF